MVTNNVCRSFNDINFGTTYDPDFFIIYVLLLTVTFFLM